MNKILENKYGALVADVDDLTEKVQETITGQLKFSSPVRNFKSGNHVISQMVNLTPGTYIMEILSDNESIHRQRIMISE